MEKTNHIQPDAITAILAELLTMKMEHKEHFFTELLVKVCTLTNPLDYSQLFTEQETADRLSYSIPTLYRLRTQSKIHYRKDGNIIRYSLGEILEYEEN